MAEARKIPLKRSGNIRRTSPALTIRESGRHRATTTLKAPKGTVESREMHGMSRIARAPPRLEYGEGVMSHKIETFVNKQRKRLGLRAPSEHVGDFLWNQGERIETHYRGYVNKGVPRKRAERDAWADRGISFMREEVEGMIKEISLAG